MRKLTVEGESPMHLKAWLHFRFPTLPKRAVGRLFQDKDIRVNGKRTGEDMEIHHGDEITLYADDATLDGTPLEVVWLSGALLVAVKPPGVSARATGEADMEELAAGWLLQKGEPAFVKA